MIIKFIKAKPISYDKVKRKRTDVKYIVIHYTGNTRDTAKGNCNYFKNGNERNAGAHYFVDSKGDICQSIALNRTAWSVGGKFQLTDGAGLYYGKCTNKNSVSIELCNCTKTYTAEQAEAVKKLIKHIRKKCPNAKYIVRHWDVNGKTCPAPMAGKNNKMWQQFLKDIK